MRMQLLRAASTEFERMVGAVPADAWDRPTPCDIPVWELVEHVIAGNRFSAMLLGAPAPEHEPEDDSDELDETDDIDPVETLEEVRASAKAQVAAFESADPESTLEVPLGRVSVETFYWLRVGELAVHAWDLARGAAIDETLDGELVGDLWELTEPNLAWMRTTGTYGEGASTDLPATATPQRRLLDAYGRRSA